MNQYYALWISPTSLQAAVSPQLTTSNDVNEVMHNLGIAPIVDLINLQSTRYSPNVTMVIAEVEAIMKAHRNQPRCQMVGFQAIRAIWFGWRATVKWPGHQAEFGEIPQGVRREFILRCIEVGTAIGARQMELAQRQK